MDTRKAIGHEYGPTPDATVTRRCPICGKPFVYAGGWCVGSTPVCSYSCQRQLVAQYKQSREYKRIQNELNPSAKLQREQIASDVSVHKLPDGPLTKNQLLELNNSHPRLSYETFQEIAMLVLQGKSNREIRQINKTKETIIHDIRVIMGYIPIRGTTKMLTEDQLKEMKEMSDAGYKASEIALRYGVSRNTVMRWIND